MNVNVAPEIRACESRAAISSRAPGRQARRGDFRCRSQRADCRRQTLHAFEAALIEHKVVMLRDQHLTTEQHVALSRQFGDLEVHPMRPQGEFPEILVLDNHKDNPVLSTDVWHSDTTFRKTPTKYTILRCQIMPKLGGDTLWADMEAAYDGLSEFVQDNDRRLARGARLPELPRAVQEYRRGPGQAAQDGRPVPQSVASGGAHPSGDRTQEHLRQSAIHAAHRRARSRPKAAPSSTCCSPRRRCRNISSACAGRPARSCSGTTDRRSITPPTIIIPSGGAWSAPP